MTSVYLRQEIEDHMFRADEEDERKQWMEKEERAFFICKKFRKYLESSETTRLSWRLLEDRCLLSVPNIMRGTIKVLVRASDIRLRVNSVAWCCAGQVLSVSD